MDRAKLSRREVLAGLAVTGSSGALVGSGTSALFSDTETFTNNAIEASASTAGVVDASVTIQSSEDTVEFTVDLPTVSNGFGNKDLPTNNNPAYIWVRSSCPDSPELASLVTVDVSVECIVDGTTTREPIFEDVTAYDVLTGAVNDDRGNLQDGLLLACPDNKCLQTENEKRKLVLDKKGYACGYEPDNDDNFGFDLEFFGQQCRYETPSDLESPFSGVLGEDDDSCDEPNPGFYGISYIEIYGCDSDEKPKDPIGKIELEDKYCNESIDGISDSYIAPQQRYDLFDGDCNDTGYDVYVKSTVEKDGGAETIAINLRLLDDGEPVDGAGPKICKIKIKGGPQSGKLTYTRADNPDCFDTNETTTLLLAPEK